MQSNEQFSIHTREIKKGRIFYVQFRDENGKRMTAKSTGILDEGRKKDYNAAVSWAINYLKAGKIVTKERVTVEQIAKDFFSWEGEWATDKKVAKKRVSERQCVEKQNATDLWIIPLLGMDRIKSIDREKAKWFRNTLYKRGLSGSRINKVLSCLKAILEYAAQKRYIQDIPTIERAGAAPERERGILTAEEAKSLFTIFWPNYEAYVMNLTAAVTGARQGELLGLRRMDVLIPNLQLRLERAWERQSSVLNPTTKAGRIRFVPITQKVADEIVKVMNRSPWRNDGDFVFFHPTRPDRPLYGKDVTQALYDAMSEIGISQKERKDRFIDFHSWRHFVNSLLLNNGVPLQKVQSVIGHLTTSMTENYYHLDGAEDIREITDDTFS